MAIQVSVESDTVYGNINGIALELDDGTLVVAPRGSYDIKRSTNGGSSWTVTHTLDDHDLTRLNFLDSRGYIFFGTESGSGNTVSSIVRSTDSGLTFEKVLTVESSASWYMIEDSAGVLYMNEYSTGLQDSQEKYAYNVWRSIDSGATWAKFYTHPAQSTPGAKDSIRHIHLLAIDSADRKYISFGEDVWGTDGGRTYHLNDDGTLGNLITTDGNGLISFVEAEGGLCYFGTDEAPNKILKLDLETGILSESVNIDTQFGMSYGTDVFDMQKGKHGVLYGLLHGIGAPYLVPPSLVASVDNGETWMRLAFTAVIDGYTSAAHLSLNRNYADSRLYIGRSVATYVSIPDYTKEQLIAKYTSTLSIKSS